MLRVGVSVGLGNLRALLYWLPGLIMPSSKRETPEQRRVSLYVYVFVSLYLCVSTPNFSLYPMFSLEDGGYIMELLQPYSQVLEQVQRGVTMDDVEDSRKETPGEKKGQR